MDSATRLDGLLALRIWEQQLWEDHFNQCMRNYLDEYDERIVISNKSPLEIPTKLPFNTEGGVRKYKIIEPLKPVKDELDSKSQQHTSKALDIINESTKSEKLSAT